MTDLSPNVPHPAWPGDRCARTAGPDIRGGQLATLKRILRGEEPGVVAFDRRNAVNLLARSDTSDDASALLGAVLANPAEKPAARLSAAQALGRHPGPVPEAALRDTLPSLEGRLRRAAVQALGRIGGMASVTALERYARQTHDPLLRRAAEFAGTLIAFREGDARTAGSARFRVQRGEPLDPTRLRRTPAVRAFLMTRDRVTGSLARTTGSRFGIRLHCGLAMTFPCGDAANLVMLNAKLRSRSIADDLLARPHLAGLVYLGAGPSMPLRVRFLILTRPSGNGAEILLTRPDGDLVYRGHARRVSSTLGISVSHVGPYERPVEITGAIAPGRLSLYVTQLVGIRSA